MIGSIISHYRILEKLGEGGMGVVYKAEDTKLGRTVAIKFLPRHISDGGRDRTRFTTEARASAALNHPNIGTIHAIEEVNYELFIVMEYVEGKELREIITGHHDRLLPIDTSLNYIVQIAQGLESAHKRGIIHRDIKPSNIMITSENRAKIMDFGLAKLPGSTQVTKLGTTLGTIAYMSPEQARGDVVDHRTDIWSFGVVIYEMLSGQPPFRSEYDQAVIYSILNDEPRSLAGMRPEIPDYLANVVKKMLQKNPDDRYQSVSDLIGDLGVNPAGQAVTRSPTDRERAAPRSVNVSRKRLMPIAASLAGLALLAVLWGTGVVDHLLGVNALPGKRHLLVLPFVNVGGDLSKQPFCDGLMETLTSKLSQLEQFHSALWVVPSSEVRQNKVQSAGEARRLFGVNLVVAGSLQPLGDVIRLTLNLVDAEELRQLNSAVIDVKSSNISELQNETVAKLLSMMKWELSPQSKKIIDAGATDIPEAYEYYVRGIGYLQRYEDEQSLDAAINVLTAAVAEDSPYAVARAALGTAYWRKYEAEKDNRWVSRALEECERALAYNDEPPEVNIAMGMVYFGTGRYDEAAHSYKRALEVDPMNATAHGGLAKTYEAKGLPDDAERTHQRAIALKPDYWGGHNDLGVFYFRHGRYDDAITQFRRVVELTPDNDRGLNNLGGIYYMQKRWDDARVMFERSLAIRKTYRVCSNLGTLYYIRGEYARAARMYETALELNENDYRVWGNLAAAYHWTPGERGRSRTTYLNAIRKAETQRSVNKHDPDLLADLAGYNAMIDEKVQAHSYLKQAMARAGDNANVLYRVGTTYEHLGDRKNALVWIDRSLQKGYSISEIEAQPELQALLADERFKSLSEKYRIRTNMK